jgi:WhiB family redox-sensing transcriptional regulator
VEENVSVTIQDKAINDRAVVFPTRESAEPRVWRSGAACRDTDPDLFFPVGQTGPAIAHIANAKEVCSTCAVQVECLEYALMTNQDAGIWGGLTEDERRKIRRERRKMNRAAQAAAQA